MPTHYLAVLQLRLENTLQVLHSSCYCTISIEHYWKLTIFSSGSLNPVEIKKSLKPYMYGQPGSENTPPGNIVSYNPIIIVLSRIYRFCIFVFFPHEIALIWLRIFRRLKVTCGLFNSFASVLCSCCLNPKLDGRPFLHHFPHVVELPHGQKGHPPLVQKF